LSTLLSDIDRRALVEKISHLEAPIGLQGGDNNCFLNSCFQYIMHSDLCDFFLNPANLGRPCLNRSLENKEYHELDEKDKKYYYRFIRNQVDFYKAFVQFAKDYSIGKNDLSTGHFRCFISTDSETVQEWSQEDASEALGAFLNYYNTQSISHEYSSTTRKEHSELVNGCQEEVHIHQIPVVELACPHTEAGLISIKTVWKNNFGYEILNDLVNIDLMDRTSRAHQTTIKTNLKLQSSGLHLRLKRVTPQILSKGFTAIDFEGALSINFGGKHYYDLQCFMVHEGALLDCGHYVAYTKLQDKWYCNNDANVTILDESQVLKAAQHGYMFCYQKIQPCYTSDSDSSDAGSVLTDEDGHPVLSPRLKSIDLLSDGNSDSGSDGSVDSSDEGAREVDHV
ncbi:MAG TPA: ubiquitin carboxyl-terminal hydrolase family protein, partial [Chlamydiales bacterium]|nr:ubiquitin carboxyl-terminal hydrolase family protein [Chlamydiales bacterium]